MNTAHPDHMGRYLENGTWEQERANITAYGMHQWIRDFNRPVRGIEIGIKEGMNTIAFLEACENVIEMIGVDPFAPYNDLGYQWSVAEQDSILGHMLKNIKVRNLEDRFKHIRLHSHDAAAQLPDGQFDFVFIDGEHTHEAITRDLELYWPKLVPDGIMSGHDWQFIGNSVLQWRNHRGITTQLVNLPHYSWAFRKS